MLRGTTNVRAGEKPADCLSLGIDLGTTNTKVALVAISGSAVRVRAAASAPTPEPRALARTLLTLVRQVLTDAPTPDSIGIASMAETGVPLDTAGTPLGDWVRWDAGRSGRAAEELSRRLGWAELVGATGVRPGAKVPLATWSWLRGDRPDVWSAMARWSGAADLAGLILTGGLVTDHTLAGRTMAYRLPTTGGALPATFDAQLLAEVGLRPDQLPDVVTPGRPAGSLVDPAFVACGLRVGTPVVIAGHDHAVGAYAAGVRSPGDVADSLGTAEAIMSVVAEPPDPVAVGAAGMSAVVTVGGGHRAILAGSAAAGALVGWWLEHEAAGRTPEQLFAEVLALPDAPSDVLVLPYLHGRQTPAPDPAARLRVIGRRADHTADQLAKSMLEGLCLQARWMVAEQLRLADRAASSTPVTVLGAPVVANPAWMRIKSRVTPRPLRTVTEPEAVTAGAAMLAAVRAGLVGPDAPVLDHQPAPSVPGTDYDRPFAAFVAAATESSELRAQPQGDRA